MADLDDIEFKIARLELGPDDVLVVRAAQTLSQDAFKRIMGTLRAVLGEGVRKVLILQPGFELAVLAPAPTDEVLATKTSTELREMFERGEISRNQLTRALGFGTIPDDGLEQLAS
jgi:hypothetical protein